MLKMRLPFFNADRGRAMNLTEYEDGFKPRKRKNTRKNRLRRMESFDDDFGARKKRSGKRFHRKKTHKDAPDAWGEMFMD